MPETLEDRLPTNLLWSVFDFGVEIARCRSGQELTAQIERQNQLDLPECELLAAVSPTAPVQLKFPTQQPSEGVLPPRMEASSDSARPPVFNAENGFGLLVGLVQESANSKGSLADFFERSSSTLGSAFLGIASSPGAGAIPNHQALLTVSAASGPSTTNAVSDGLLASQARSETPAGVLAPEGDRNHDTFPDAQQPGVAALRAFSGGVVTLDAGPHRLTGVRVDAPPSPESAGVSLPFGLFSFSVAGVTPGDQAIVTMMLPEGSEAHHYYSRAGRARAANCPI
jgi:hypothetical protein